MSEWIFFRDPSVDLRDVEPVDLLGDVFFDLWRTRQQPYNPLKDGDTVWLLDRRDRMLIWEFRVRHLLTRPYGSMVEALGLLRSGYGILPRGPQRLHLAPSGRGLPGGMGGGGHSTDSGAVAGRRTAR